MSIIETTSKKLGETLDSVNNIDTPPIPTPLLFNAGETHKGLDYERVAKKVFTALSKLEPKIPILSVLENGDKSLPEQVITILIKEVFEELINNSRVEIAIAPGLGISGIGASAGGPVTVKGATTGFAKGNGIII